MAAVVSSLGRQNSTNRPIQPSIGCRVIWLRLLPSVFLGTSRLTLQGLWNIIINPQVRGWKHLPRRVLRGRGPWQGSTDDLPRLHPRGGVRWRVRPRGEARARHLRVPKGRWDGRRDFSASLLRIRCVPMYFGRCLIFVDGKSLLAPAEAHFAA